MPNRMRELHARQCLPHELLDLSRRAHLNQKWRFLDQVTLVHGRANRQEEFGPSQIAIVIDICGIDGRLDKLQGKRDEIAWDNRLEEISQFFIQKIGRASCRERVEM